MKKIKVKNIIWALIALVAASVTTYKITVMYFYYVAATNNTTAPFAALITSIPIGFVLFNYSVRFYRNLIKLTRYTLRAIA